MQNLKFTDLSVRSLKPGLYFDDALPSFGMRVGKNRRTWVVIKGSRDHRTKVKLGNYPALSLAEARGKAHITLGTPHVARSQIKISDAQATFVEENYRGKSIRSKSEAKRLLLRLRFTKTLASLTDTDCHAALYRLSHVPSE